MHEKFGQVLKEIRNSKKLSLYEVVEKTGISISCLSLIENSKTQPQAKTIKKLADVYEVDYIELYKRLEKGE